MNKPKLKNSFPYLLVDDFFPHHILADLEQKIREPLPTLEHPAGYLFRAIFDEKLIRFLYRFVRAQVSAEFNQEYRFSPIYKLPQLYQIHGPWRGLPPHMDNQPGRDLAMIIYLSRDWKPKYGGELQLLDLDMNPFTTIEPVFNRAVFFPLGNQSWHEVLPLKHEWTRTTLIQDWAGAL